MAARTLEDYRTTLAKNIERLEAGEVSPAVGNAIAGSVGIVLRSVKLEMEYFRMTGKTPSIPLLDGGKAA
jgi:hypothetical protein